MAKNKDVRDEDESVVVIPGQTTIPGLEDSDKLNAVPKQDPSVAESKEEEKSESSSEKKRSWGELMFMENIMVPASTSGEKLSAYLPLEEGPDTNSSAEMKQWLCKSIEDGELPPGKYMILRKVEVLEIKEVRRVEVSEATL